MASDQTFPHALNTRYAKDMPLNTRLDHQLGEMFGLRHDRSQIVQTLPLQGTEYGSNPLLGFYMVMRAKESTSNVGSWNLRTIEKALLTTSLSFGLFFSPPFVAMAGGVYTTLLAECCERMLVKCTDSGLLFVLEVPNHNFKISSTDTAHVDRYCICGPYETHAGHISMAI